jgi:hypothetical protein
MGLHDTLLLLLLLLLAVVLNSMAPAIGRRSTAAKATEDMAERKLRNPNFDLFDRFGAWVWNISSKSNIS